MRTFVALELSETAKAGILSVIQTLRESGVRASWSRPSTMHLTLRFLGEVQDERVGHIIDAVERAAQVASCFVMSTSRLGAFPSPRRPRVIWAGVDAPSPLYELQASLESELRSQGFVGETKRFHPHVTLGRLREPVDDMGHLLETVRVPEERTEVRHVSVMKSTLTPTGPVHEVVCELPLAGAPNTPEEDKASP